MENRQERELDIESVKIWSKNYTQPHEFGDVLDITYAEQFVMITARTPEGDLHRTVYPYGSIKFMTTKLEMPTIVPAPEVQDDVEERASQIFRVID